MVHCGLNAARSGNYQHSSGSQGAETTLTWIQRFGLTGVSEIAAVIVPGDSVTARQSDIHPCCSVRWWGYQRSNGIPDFSCDALKVLWVFTWTLSRFTGYVSRRSIRVRINQWKATSRVTRPRKVARVSQSRSKIWWHLSHFPCSVIILKHPGLEEFVYCSRSLSDLLLTITSWVCFQYLKSIRRNTFQKTIFAKYNDPTKNPISICGKNNWAFLHSASYYLISSYLRF